MRNHFVFSPKRYLGEGCRMTFPAPDSDSARSHPRAQGTAGIHRGAGWVQTLIETDTCHLMMISEPESLAAILVERCRLYA
jgi:hypothetical protein